MAILYFAFAIILIICNITEIPAAIKVIVTAAFTPKAVTGGTVGSMFVAMQKVLPAVFSQMRQDSEAPRSQQLLHRQKNLSVRDLSA